MLTKINNLRFADKEKGIASCGTEVGVEITTNCYLLAPASTLILAASIQKVETRHLDEFTYLIGGDSIDTFENLMWTSHLHNLNDVYLDTALILVNSTPYYNKNWAKS